MKKYFKVILNKTNSIANELVTMAALANGGKDVTFVDMNSYAKMQTINYPSLHEGITVSIVGPTLLLDKGTENILIIEEREEMELNELPQISTEEAKDILLELNPVLNRQ